MDAKRLSTWIKARRGRASELARRLKVSKQFVGQMAAGQRPIPEPLRPFLEQLVSGSGPL